MSEEPAESEVPVLQLNNMGPRYARICGRPPKEGCSWRSFGSEDARCPEHGGPVKIQPDAPYFGKPVTHGGIRAPEHPKEKETP